MIFGEGGNAPQYYYWGAASPPPSCRRHCSSHMLIIGLIGRKLPEKLWDSIENLLFSSESVPHNRSGKQYICKEIKTVFV